MCIDPATAGLAISVVGAVVGYAQKQQESRNQQNAINSNAAIQNQQTQQRYAQVNQQATDEMSVRARQALVEQGRLRAIGGESGLVGGSLDRIENESAFNQGSDIASIENNRKNAINQTYLEAQGGVARSQSQMNSVQRPSLIGAGLQIAGAGVEYQTTVEKQKAAAAALIRAT